MSPLFIASREAIPHDGSRRAVASGHLERELTEAEQAELEAIRQAGYRAWGVHHGQQGEAG